MNIFSTVVTFLKFLYVKWPWGLLGLRKTWCNIDICIYRWKFKTGTHDLTCLPKITKRDKEVSLPPPLFIQVGKSSSILHEMKAATKTRLIKITKLKKKKDYKAITWQFISDHNVPSSVLKYILAWFHQRKKTEKILNPETTIYSINLTLTTASIKYINQDRSLMQLSSSIQNWDPNR